MMSRPRLVLTELREYRSERTGSTYFAGYLGKARVVMLRDERAEITGKEVARWNLLVEEPEPREGRQDRAGGTQGGREGPRASDGRRKAVAAVQGAARAIPSASPTDAAARARPPSAGPATFSTNAASIRPRTCRGTKSRSDPRPGVTRAPRSIWTAPAQPA